MAELFKVLNHALKPIKNLLAGRPVLATFQVNLHCNSACGYCDLPQYSKTSLSINICSSLSQSSF